MAQSLRGPVSRWRGLFLLFFLSGISGLIYESIWSRYIRQFVGSAATAQILVLSLFMGGMSLGALLAGRWVSRIRAPVVVYGVIEGLIGLYALLFPSLHDGMTRVCYDHVFPFLGGGLGVELVKWGLAGLLILPPCILLGTTFPVMSVGILRRDPRHSGEILSFLYFTNSFGAAFGAMLSGFVLVGRLGLPGTLMVAAALNMLIMLLALRDRGTDPPLVAAEPTGVSKDAADRRLVTLFLVVAFGTGLSSFMYEIGWIRLLSMVIGSATHSFEVMLSAFVLGLALGGLWVRKRMDRWRHPGIVLGGVQLVMGMTAIATLPLYEVAVSAMSWLMSDEDGRSTTTWIAFNVLRYLLSLLIMLPATFCAGMTLPLLTHVMLRRGRPEAVVGNIYGVNTLGAIAGATTAGLLLMPLIGLKGIIVLGAVIDMMLGLTLLRIEIARGGAPRGAPQLLRNAGIGTVAITLLGLFVVDLDPRHLTSTVFRRGRRELPEYLTVLSYVDGRSASVTVVENTSRPGHRVVYTNGKPDASVVLDRWPTDRAADLGPDIAGDEPNQFLVGLLPLMVRPDAKSAALIGFGSGVTCHTLLGSPNLERLDTIEIEREMVRAGRYFEPVNSRAFTDPRNHIWYDDAKAYFASAARTYDIIVSEPTNPWVSGVASLFTTEFYREAKRYLAPGGVFGQWVQGYELSNELLASVLAAIDDEFADYLIMRIGSRDWVILAVAAGEVARPDPVVLSWPHAREQFEILGIHDIGQVDGLMTANRRILHWFVADLVPNTDRLPLLDTGAERTRFFRDSAEMLHSLRWTPAPLLAALGGIERRPYPRRGIGDYREPHILREPEQAMWLMRAFETDVDRTPEGVYVTNMQLWKDATRGLQTGDGWERWMSATYEIYRETASHFAVHDSQWWTEVLRHARGGDAPPSIRDAVELLDALSRLDGHRLRKLSMAALASSSHPLPRPFLGIAGLVALELEEASAAERQRFGAEHMTEDDIVDSSEGYAYRVLRAYVMRP